jgi:hypothetical protein
MTPENKAKENYLRRYQWDLQELEQMEQELAQLRLKALPGGIAYDGMPHGSGDNKADLANYAATLDDFLAQTEERRHFLLTEIRAIKQAIEAVPVQRSRILLRHIYVNGTSWDDAAEVMGYSSGYVKRALKSEALTNFQIP